MKFEAYAVVNLLCQRHGVELCRTLVGKFGKIVRLELYSVEFVVASQFCYLLLAFLTRQLVLAVLVGSEFLEKVLFAEFLTPLFLGSELFGNGEEGHDWCVLYVVDLHLV